MPSLPRQDTLRYARFRVVVPRLWGWCRVSPLPDFETYREARDWLTQLGPIDGKIVSVR